MNRLKFKIWDNILSKFLFNGEGQNIQDCGYEGEVEYLQFTGLYDSNKVEIYEGDILAHTYEEWKDIFSLTDYKRELKQIVRRGFIVWDEETAGFSMEHYDIVLTCAGKDDGKPIRGLIPRNEGNIKIIGNIYGELHQKLFNVQKNHIDKAIAESCTFNPKNCQDE